MINSAVWEASMQLFTALYDSTLTQDTHFCGDRWSQRFGNARFGLITYESSFCGRLSLFASPPCCFAAGFTCHYIAHLSLGSRSQGKSLLVTLLSLLYATSVTFAGRTCYSSLCYISHLSLVALLQVAFVTSRFVAGRTCHSSLCCRLHLSLIALLQVALVTSRFVAGRTCHALTLPSWELSARWSSGSGADWKRKKRKSTTCRRFWRRRSPSWRSTANRCWTNSCMVRTSF